MFEIKVTVTNAVEKSNAEYVRDHFEEFADGLNGGYITIFEGDVQDIDTPAQYENEPNIMEIYNTIFGEKENDA